jgi:hypothetical protein
MTGKCRFTFFLQKEDGRPEPFLRPSQERSSSRSPRKVASQFLASFGSAYRIRSFRKSSSSSPDSPENKERRRRKKKVVKFPENPVERGSTNQQNKSLRFEIRQGWAVFGPLKLLCIARLVVFHQNFLTVGSIHSAPKSCQSFKNKRFY